MAGKWFSKRSFLRVSALLVFLIGACGGGAGGGSCGGGGCGGSGGCDDPNYDYPRNDPSRPDAIIIPEATRVRITQKFIDFIKPEIPNLILASASGQAGVNIDMDGIMHMPIPDQELFNIGIASAHMRDAELLIWLDDLSQRLDLQFEAPNQIRLSINNLRIGIAMDVREEFAGIDASCPIVGTLGSGMIKHAAEISIEAVIDPGVGPDPDRLFDIRTSIDDIALNDMSIRVVSSSIYCQEAECRDCTIEVGGNCWDIGGRCGECRTFCGGLTDGLLAVVGGLLDLFRPLINSIMKPIIQGFIDDALADINNQAAKLEMQVSLAELSGIDALKQANPFGIYAAPEPGRFPVIDRGTGNGLEVTVAGGAEAELSPCIGTLEPFNMTTGPVPVLGGTDSQGRPYHMAMTIASAYINQMMYAVHRSGSLCLKLKSEDIRELTGGQFNLNASILSLLASDLSLLASDAAPVIIQLSPKHQPLIDIGSGEITGQDAMGNDIFDWLLKLNVEDMGLAFHVLIQDRYVRIFEVTMDINIGMNIMTLPDNSLEVNIGELRIDDFDEVFNELLPNADFAMVLPTLVDLALQALISNQLKFNLDLSDAISGALGGAPIYMRINDIFRDGIQDDFLTLTMTFTSSRSTNLSLAADTFAELHEDNGLHERMSEKQFKPTGRIRLQVGGPLAYSDQHALEYQLRVDKGVWRVPQAPRPDGSIYVYAPQLVLPGEHLVEVRARYVDAYETLDATPREIEVLVDPIAPEVSALMNEAGLLVTVNDLHSPAEKLKLFGRFDKNSDWFSIKLEGEEIVQALISMDEVGTHTELELMAEDSIGNQSKVIRFRVGMNALMAHPGPQDSSHGESEKSCSCESVDDSKTNSSSLLFTVLLLGLAFVRRRRQN